MRQRFQDELLDRYLKTYLPNVEPAALELMRECMEWVELPGGQTLMTQGEAGDAMYMVLSGRLRAIVNNEDGTPQTSRETRRRRNGPSDGRSHAVSRRGLATAWRGPDPRRRPFGNPGPVVGPAAPIFGGPR